MLISLAAPPSGGSHATRIAALIEECAAEGIEVCLLTAWTPEQDRAKSALFQRVQKHAQVISPSGGVLRTAAVSARSVQQPRLAYGIQRVRAAVRKWMMPDTYIGWVPGAVRQGITHIATHGADLIISSGAPFSAHIAGFMISQKAGVPLVLDYGDPWVFEPGRPRKGLRLMIERWLEKTILRKAQLVSVTTNATVSLYQARFPDVDCPYHVFPMGYDEHDYVGPLPAPDSRDTPLKIVYAGRINEEYRTIDGLVEVLNIEEALHGASRVQYQFYGSELGQLQLKLGRYVHSGLVRLENSLDHSDYIDKIRSADGLLVFGNSSKIQIPGKIAHFLAARKPILYLPNMNAESDPALELLRLVQRTQVFTGSDADTYAHFIAACRDRIPPELDEAAYRGLEWKAICNRFLSRTRATVQPQSS